MIKTISAVLALFLILFLALKLLAVKRQLRAIAVQLAAKAPACSFISVALMDRDLNHLVTELNRQMEAQALERAAAKQRLHWEKEAVAAVSHDMRTPLTSMMGYLQLLERSALNDEQREYLNIIMGRTRSLNGLIQDFFELSALEASGDVPVLENVDLPAVLGECILDHFPQFEARGMKPVFPGADTPAFILADPMMVERILQNLISNGIRYSSGDLLFSVEIVDEHVLLTVKNPVDPGNIPDPEHLFDKFYRADRSRTGQSRGLGLATVRTLAGQMGGRAWADVEDGWLCIFVEFRSSSDLPELYDT